MKNILIITKHFIKDLQVFSEDNNYTITYFDGELNDENKLVFPSELEGSDYDEIWIWDLYFEKLTWVLYLLLEKNVRDKHNFKVINVLTNSNFDLDYLTSQIMHSVEINKITIPLITGETKSGDAVADTYLESLIDYLVIKVMLFRQEIELKWPGYFEAKKVFIPNSDYTKIYLSTKEDFSNFIKTGFIGEQNGRQLGIADIIYFIGKKLDVNIEVNEEEKIINKAINKLFFNDVLDLWVSASREETIIANIPEDIEVLIVQSIDKHNNQFNENGIKALDGLQERRAVNENGSFRYFVSDKKEESIIIVNALGLSIDLWTSLINLLKKNYQVVIWETRCGDIEKGGMEAVVSIDEHVDDLTAVMRKEGLQNSHILAWCNGARIAIKAAYNNPDIRSLILLAPVFKGINDFEADDTLFEIQLDGLFNQVKRNPKKAKFLADFFKKMINKRPDIVSLKESDLLGYSNQNVNDLVFVPMCSADYLVNYAQRTENDEGYDILPLMKQVKQNVLFILGENDSVVSNNLITQVADAFQRKEQIMLEGGSHYMQFQNTKLIYDAIMSFLHEGSRLNLLSNRISDVNLIDNYTI